MLRILMKTASSLEKSGGSIPADRCDDVDLSTWEFVDASQSDDEDLCSFDGDDVISEGDGIIGADDPRSDPSQARQFVSPGDVISILSSSPPMTLPVEMTVNNRVYHRDGGFHDDDVDGDDYDDELLPWKLKDKFGKQRIRKLGKRGGAKLNKSKRMPIYHNRPGCLYGKHGFGVQHSFI